jgi:hypothetical protein
MVDMRTDNILSIIDAAKDAHGVALHAWFVSLFAPRQSKPRPQASSKPLRPMRFAR